MPRLLCALALATAVACDCGSSPPVPAPDGGGGGTGGGGGSAGGSGGGTGGGTGGGAGGGGGANARGPRCVGPYDAGTLPQGELPFSELCPALREGILGASKANATACNEPIEEKDIPHLLGDTRALHCGDGGLLLAYVTLLAHRIDAGTMGYDPAKAFACRALGRATHQCLPFDPIAQGPCGEVFTGKVGLGASCSESEECQGELYCQPQGPASCAGVCATRLAPGAACNPDRDLCQRGAPCLRGDGGFVCTAKKAAGESCAQASDCARGTACVASICVAPKGLGASCVDSAAHGDCEDELGCVQVGSGRQCRPRAKLNEACDSRGTTAPPCLKSECLSCVSGKCIAAGVEDAPCAKTSDCRDVYYCGDAGTCLFRARRGEPCRRDTQLRGSCLYLDDYCRVTVDGGLDGVCAAVPGPGEACGSPAGHSSDCAQNTYCKYASGDRGLCSAKPGPGEVCGERPGQSSECATGRCSLDAGICEAPLARGAPCEPRRPNCADGLYCDESALQPSCADKKAAGLTCAADSECQGGLCDRTNGRCSQPCSVNHDNEGASCRSGCPHGLRDGSFWLLFALCALPRLARRDSRCE